MKSWATRETRHNALSAGRYSTPAREHQGSTRLCAARTVAVRPARFSLTAWYAPEVKRYVRLAYESFASMGVVLQPHSRDVLEPVEAT